ncbi:50S ribosomal protein L6 [Methanimicrococcus blatticola]|uniref:Large ribosomal subunit protein uL6 n=1 Tax=Methanimicrococcus blatticola TaxID=91560 RepID=A0A484F5B8_9EURY|nr:50S ribosomal protein L6 [Methanimicrococcus blatticola]MBZ3936261.1 50S ribosomal protein L6 [Methanimicrococcus blatticola]MCC2508264.1 50S ribosomal protein L6 [Methanimicrococcus blatticola]TDQ70281.1 LSU ribosomal protein L6P [Methanimicrococcus blatticola]
MAKEISRSVEVPAGVTVTYDNRIVTVKGPKGENTKELYYPGIVITLNEGEVVVDSDIMRKNYKAMAGTYASHIRNMIKGVTEGFEYKMNIVYSHFPMQTKVEGKTFVISNFLGEKKPRVAKIVGNTTVKISGNSVVVSGVCKEDVGQTTANIEQKTKIKRFDPRVFQDGIYVVEK